ncbi:MAG TPA: hypothetical protein PKC45_17585, partial [Gemmatales bacterium]|nr:hypothetical protein [Gemmatales bacterium]
FVCGPGRSLRLEVEARARPGPFAAEVRPVALPRGDAESVPLAAARLLARVWASGEPERLDLSIARRLALAPDRVETLPIAAPARGCVEVLAALDQGGRWVELRLRDGVVGEPQRARGAHTASQRLCGTDRARAGTVELSVDEGPADALVVVRSVPAP